MTRQGGRTRQEEDYAGRNEYARRKD
jgi:hypothetical protein